MTNTVATGAAETVEEFLSSVSNGAYDRQVVTGLGKFFTGTAPPEMSEFYSRSELRELRRLSGTRRDVEARMPVKITKHYFSLASRSPALRTLVKARPAETADLQGAEDPGHQLSFSPVEGLIHKYEMALIYVASTCSAHCRFCYREELIARKNIRRTDGTTAPKGLAQIGSVTEYIRKHNEAVGRNGGKHPASGRGRLREVLLSGGDPMVLSNRRIAEWLCKLADAGVEAIRIGTKEIAFFPDRFDDSFLGMLDGFHALYPQVRLRFMIHFSHPDELLQKGDDGAYLEDPAGGYRWWSNTLSAVRKLSPREWISLENQSPLIRGVNDDSGALHLLQRELKQQGIGNHYFFCGRDIVGHRAFNIPIETAWNILNESQKGLSGVEAQARLSITHFKGKTEVVAVTSEPIRGLAGSENGVVIFKLLRSISDAAERGRVAIVGRNPRAIWFSGYEDRVLLDEAGLFVPEAGLEAPLVDEIIHLASDRRLAIPA